MGYKATFATEGTYVPDGLVAGNAHLLVGRQVTIAATAGVLPRGVTDRHNRATDDRHIGASRSGL